MFKVGDWIEYQIEQYPLGVVTNFGTDDFVEISIGTSFLFVPNKYLKLWQPKEGEWCWFYDNFGDAYLKKFKQMCPKVPTNYVSEQGLISEYVEPFIGELPSWIK